MRLHPNDDQAMFLSALDQMMQGKSAAWRTSPQWDRYEWSDAFDRELEESGFLDCAIEETLGPVAAAEMTFRLATLPIAVEAAASALLRPKFAADLPRPLAIIESDHAQAIRFLPVARSVLSLGGDSIMSALIEPHAVASVESLYAFPMGVLKKALDWRPLNADPEAVRAQWRVALAAELAGALKGALASVVSHVRERHQFGRPLGSFQAIQHRLAGAATKVEASYWLTLKAAQSGDSIDAALALGYAQDASTKVVYDLHQFMGAMGLTLEHPLHRWTYRARLLRSSLRGSINNLRTVAVERWRAA
ncbi:acyl-CoA dehydrogenase family protein [Terrarubrum flagellatum]|uniref:acyl-CoA dehydrogenase family protein n=1 Tax=Terrirubrum flagellatum TaxID=2895980 RepID=UPI003144F267